MKYKSATKSSPKKCECGGKFNKPHVHKPTSWRDLNAPFSEPRRWDNCTQLAQEKDSWYCQCGKCGIFAVWSFPNVWVERSPMPLFNTRRIII